MAYAEADRRMSSRHGHRNSPGQDPNELVWLVQVIGSFWFEGMTAAGSSEHPIYEAKERDYLYSAVTGQEIEEIAPDTTLAGHDAKPTPPSPATPAGAVAPLSHPTGAGSRCHGPVLTCSS